MVEDDGAEVPTVVVSNEVLSGVGALQTACSNALMLQQSLVQSKQHLQEEKDRETRRVLLLSTSTNSVFSAMCSRGICHKVGELCTHGQCSSLKNIM